MPSREDAWKLLCEYTASESLRKHMLAVKACVRAYARKAGADEETWGLAALLHDFDYERWPTRSTPPIRGILRKARRFCAKTATPRKSFAPFFLTRTIATSRANPRWSTRSLPATSSPAFSPLRLRSPVQKYSRSRGGLREAPHERQTLCQSVSRDDVRKGAEELGIPLEEHITFASAPCANKPTHSAFEARCRNFLALPARCGLMER